MCACGKRCRNYDVINYNQQIIDMIQTFKCVTYDQMVHWLTLKKLIQGQDRHTVEAFLQRLAMESHFSIFPEKRLIARLRSDLGCSLKPMQVYLDFLEMGDAGSVFPVTGKPYTVVIFERPKEHDLIEIIIAPDTESGIRRMNEELLLYDLAVQDALPGLEAPGDVDGDMQEVGGIKRIVIVPEAALRRSVHVRGVALYAVVLTRVRGHTFYYPADGS